MIYNRLLAFAIALICACLTNSAPAADLVVSKASWLSDMRNILPASFCKEGGYFRECFTISAAVCHSTATKATESCLRQYEPEIPQRLKQPSDGSFWGNKVGVCAGTLFGVELSQYRVNNTKEPLYKS